MINNSSDICLPISNFLKEKKLHVLLCYSGSVATLKIPEIVTKIISLGPVEIRLIGSSKAANHFLKRSKKYNPHYYEKFMKLGGYDLIIEESDEWSWNQIGDPVIHIELRKWADLILIAPASADLIAKTAQGISDSLLLSVLRAWDFTQVDFVKVKPNKPCILCPAMNSLMWVHPSTQESLEKLKKWGWTVVEPTTKKLACNDTGKGALEEVNKIVQLVRGSLETRIEMLTSNDDRDTQSNVVDEIFMKKRDQRKWIFVNNYDKDSVYLMVITATALLGLTAGVVIGVKMKSRI